MQHIELRLADVQERQRAPQADRDAERAAARAGPSSLRRQVGQSLIRLGASRRRRRDRLPRRGRGDPAARSRPGSGLLPDPGATSERNTPLALLTHELKASYAFVERNFFLTRRYWGWEIAFLVYSVAGALSISLIGAAAGDDAAAPDPHHRRHLLELPVASCSRWIAETIAVERWEGTLEYTFMAPIRRWTQLLGSCVYAMVYGLVHTAVILIVMMIFFRQLDPRA